MGDGCNQHCRCAAATARANQQEELARLEREAAEAKAKGQDARIRMLQDEKEELTAREAKEAARV